MNNKIWMVKTEEGKVKKVNWDELLQNGERYEVLNNPDERIKTEEDVQREKEYGGEYAEESWLFDMLSSFLTDDQYFTIAEENNVLLEEEKKWISKCDLTKAFSECDVHYFFVKNGVCIYGRQYENHVFCPLSGEDKEKHFPTFFYMAGSIHQGVKYYDDIIFTNFERTLKYMREELA